MDCGGKQADIEVRRVEPRPLDGAFGPRHRLFQLGASALSDVELLATVLGTGSRGQSASDAAQGLLKATGGLKGICQRYPQELCTIAGFGRRRTAQVLAALELGRRVQCSIERRPRLQSPAEIYAYLAPILATLRREVFHVLSFNSRGVLLSDARVAEGTLNQCPVDPREVFSAALAAQATAIVLAHNHPSGDPEPSALDLDLTYRLAEGGRILGIKVLDHLILGHLSYRSLLERGEMQTNVVRVERNVEAAS